MVIILLVVMGLASIITGGNPWSLWSVVLFVILWAMDMWALLFWLVVRRWVFRNRRDW